MFDAGVSLPTGGTPSMIFVAPLPYSTDVDGFGDAGHGGGRRRHGGGVLVVGAAAATASGPVVDR
jgi:hypothetical protein